MNNLLSIKEASKWVTEHYGKQTSPSQISYLMQYGHLKKIGNNSSTKVLVNDLKKYFDSHINLEMKMKERLGKDLNWTLSFHGISEKERTKHVHRLHPYKGKFIPQLVEYFLDDHVDNFKKHVYFKPDDIVIDPFCGSGTTLVQANELGINAIGIDVSEFNAQISNIKVHKHNLQILYHELRKIYNLYSEFIYNSKAINFENDLLNELNKFNNKNFPSPKFKYQVRHNEIDEWNYAKLKENEFDEIFNKLVKKHKLKIIQNKHKNFIDKWYLLPVRDEIDYVLSLIEEIHDKDIKQVVKLILSRTIRSCRATSHSDLATLIKPITKTYYCHKHYKICKPLFSMFGWWKRYSEDTLKRLSEFDLNRTNTYQICLTGDSRKINIFDSLEKINSIFGETLKEKKIKGIFTSPPYVGLINYHEQHAYAYDLFGYDRKDKLEIGPLFKGKGKEARISYVEGISDVLLNTKKYLAEDYDVFLVANDKFNLYPKIAKNAGMKIINEFKRPVLNRTEKDKSAYSETIFHMKEE
ncbi:MAG: site-specific DNA-methyltransferase [Candidatus Cloacimonetes bacterium]|nr:site-specific DNA-methyltransferase [Candidatus Cloacimonadota bacterium]MCF7814454.1 site-specific DNA-methyltransferase [Candidatus Cloacimonadota bacterium]MCF7869029.1 site-specific DNA-methyltransferase [Candidatus Cloacimonadota bacterium]MCF7884424.1 site-specific DNA-methyltransferase [Candidatus Cloacimonadota bacterium]